MPIVDRLVMFGIVVKDMAKAKAFYVDKLGLKVMTDYRQDDDHWWVSVRAAKDDRPGDVPWWRSLAAPDGGVTMTLTTFHENAKPGKVSLYFATSDVASAHKDLSGKGLKVSEIGDDLFGPGSGVKWFNLEDPDGNLVHFVQEQT